MKLYRMDINEVEFDDDHIIWTHTGRCEQLDRYISADRLEQAAKFRHEADRKRSLCAGYLLNHALLELGLDLKAPVNVACADANGKPYLPEYPEIHFNLSHSGDFAVCVLSDRPVGIDIEECKEVKEKIAERFFAAEEYEDICMIADEQERTRRFYTYWVLKESFMKATGLGMQLAMNAFRVHLGETISYEHQVNDRTYEGQLIDIGEQYCMAVCREV